MARLTERPRRRYKIPWKWPRLGSSVLADVRFETGDPCKLIRIAGEQLKSAMLLPPGSKCVSDVIQIEGIKIERPSSPVQRGLVLLMSGITHCLKELLVAAGATSNMRPLPSGGPRSFGASSSKHDQPSRVR